MAMLSAFSCNPGAPPPVTVPPETVDLTVTPEPVVPGESVTVEATATHPLGIRNMSVSFSGPEQQTMGSSFSCSEAVVTQLDVTEFRVSRECAVPIAAPNGEWEIWVVVEALDGARKASTSPVVVAGGTNDDDGPELTIVTDVPDTISRGESFTIELRATDPNPPVTALSPLYAQQGGPFVDNDAIACDPPSLTAVSAGIVDVAIVCQVPTDVNWGQYWGGYSVRDDFGNRSGAYRLIQVL